MLLRLLVLTSILQGVTSYKHFQLTIPNGANVPFPCKPGKIWQGVGHFLNAGTGILNPFGVDFAAAGHNWTEALCRKDSDGDGRTNGQELGDPDCVWNENSIANITDSLSHPGICDPWNSITCSQKAMTGSKYKNQQEWLKDACKSDVLDCPALNEPEVKNLTVRLTPATQVPAKETTYECQIFDLHALGLPTNDNFHLVAVTPIINNTNVLHHMVLSGCTDNIALNDVPFECGMLASERCQQFLHVWTVGLNGECYHPQSGVPIGGRTGDKGYRIVAIQLHWNNPGKYSEFVDSSGLVLHYTPKLRHYDAGVLMIGSTYFYLPPKREEVIVHSVCASGCTKNAMIGPVNVTAAWNHMHYAGRKMNIEVKRDNKSLTYLTDDKTYSYDSPQVHSYETPLTLLPGDDLLTVCGFNTMNRNKTTFFGEATTDEMCFGFLTYYPLENYTQPFCLDKMEISPCNPPSYAECPELFSYAKNITNTSVYQEVTRDCQRLFPCVTECQETVLKFFRTDPCLSGHPWQFLQERLMQVPDGLEFLVRVRSCQSEVYAALHPPEAVPDNSRK